MIFLHSSFRVSSTWLWSHFRRSERVIAYGEVFHETLANITPADIGRLKPNSWYSKHPDGAAYFLEFLPMLGAQGGVEGFAPPMAFEHFVPEGGIRGVLDGGEKAYLGRLIAHAESLGRIPVLSETRSLGRMHAIKAAFPGFHVLIYRNLFRQWCSYTEQYFYGNPYFFDTIQLTLEHVSTDPFLSLLRDLFPLHEGGIGSVNHFCCFVLMHVYLYAQVADAADLIVDVGLLVRDADYRRGVESRIYEAAGVQLDLSDARNEIGFSFVGRRNHEAAVEQVRILADAVIAAAPSDAGQKLASMAFAELLEQWTEYDNYAGALSKAAGPEGLMGERENLLNERARLVGEKDRLIAELDRNCFLSFWSKLVNFLLR